MQRWVRVRVAPSCIETVYTHKYTDTHLDNINICISVFIYIYIYIIYIHAYIVVYPCVYIM